MACNFKRLHERAINKVRKHETNDFRGETANEFALDANTDGLSVSEEEFKGFEPLIDAEIKIKELLAEQMKLQRPYACEICSRRFKTKYHLHEHAQRHFTKIVQYHCDKCDAHFLVTTHYKNHTCTK